MTFDVLVKLLNKKCTYKVQERSKSRRAKFHSVSWSRNRPKLPWCMALSYHGADHPADVDGVAAGGVVLRSVPQTLGIDIQQLQTDLHHVFLKL